MINKKVSSVAGKLLVLLKDNVSIVCNSPQVLSAIVKELYLASLSTISRIKNAKLVVGQTFQIACSALTQRLAQSAMGPFSSLSTVFALVRVARTPYMMPKKNLVDVRKTTS